MTLYPEPIPQTSAPPPEPRSFAVTGWLHMARSMCILKTLRTSCVANTSEQMAARWIHLGWQLLCAGDTTTRIITSEWGTISSTYTPDDGTISRTYTSDVGTLCRTNTSFEGPITRTNTSPSGPGTNTSLRARLVADVKALQRCGRQQAWKSFTKSRGLYTLDPQRLSLDRLQEFLDCIHNNSKINNAANMAVLTPSFGCSPSKCSTADTSSGSPSALNTESPPGKKNTNNYSIENPPRISRQLNQWLGTLNDVDFMATFTRLHFSETCHPNRATSARELSLIKWMRTSGSDGPSAGDL